MSYGMAILHALIGQPRLHLGTLNVTVGVPVPEGSVKFVGRVLGAVEPVDRFRMCR